MNYIKYNWVENSVNSNGSSNGLMEIEDSYKDLELIRLRDTIAISAMNRLLSMGHCNNIAERAYEYADRMLAVRSETDES